MTYQAKEVTEDIVQVLDTKILATGDHGEISVSAGDNYSTVLSSLALFILTSSEKTAINSALTIPSATNPVVLKNDLPTYYPAQDLGEIKDAVIDIVSLPAFGNTEGDIRPVLNAGALYRWDGSAWGIFIQTGVLDHTQLLLSSLNASTDFQHLSATERTLLLSQTHAHANKTTLDSIISLGSGQIITVSERARVPTTDQKAALAGTVGSPSLTNRYVTTIDPRLNTVKNPYITFGPLGSGATFQGEEVGVFQQALAAVAPAGSSSEVKAIEFLPGTYDFNNLGDFSPVVWGTPSQGLLLQALAARSTVFKFETFCPALQLIGPGTNPVIVRGFTFEVRGLNTSALLIERAGSVIEDCTFTTGAGAVLANNHKALVVNADNCVIRRCNFSGVFSYGIIINGNNCRIEDCEFTLSDNASFAVDLTASRAIVNSCKIYSGTLRVQSSAEKTQITKSFHNVGTGFIDLGSDTRWLGGQTEDYQQAFIGRTRTVGPPSSYADFRGSSETVFLAALADPYTTELEILEGSYLFTSSVTLPENRRLRGVRSTHGASTGAQILSPPGAPAFILNNGCQIEQLAITSYNSPGLSASTKSNILIKGCYLTLAAGGVGDYALSFDGCSESEVIENIITGLGGVALTGSCVRSAINNCLFSTVNKPITTSSASYLQLGYNVFSGAQAANLSGNNFLVIGNHFLNAIPTKVNTTNSLWRGNWPSPQANNEDGIDLLSVSLAQQVQPILGTGAARSKVSDTAVITFVPDASGTAATLPVKLSSRLNRNLGYTVEIYWISEAFSGFVLWEVTVVFRDRSGLDLGSYVTKTVLSQRTHLTIRQEEYAAVNFLSSEYGFVPGVDPTHVSVKIRRLGENPSDTLPGNANLTEVRLLLPRD